MKSLPILIEIERQGTNAEFVSGSLSKARKKALTLNKLSNFMHHLSLVLQFFLLLRSSIRFSVGETAELFSGTDLE